MYKNVMLVYVAEDNMAVCGASSADDSAPLMMHKMPDISMSSADVADQQQTCT